jgi:hypothetical protein
LALLEPVGVPGVAIPLLDGPDPDPLPVVGGDEFIEDLTLDVICLNGKRGLREVPIERLELDLSNRSIPIVDCSILVAGWDF